MVTSFTVRSFLCFLGVFMVTTEAQDETQSTVLPFKPPCPVKRMEITFPHVIDVQNTHVKSAIPGYVNHTDDQWLPKTLPEAFFLEFTWRRHKIQLALYRSQITTPTSFSEWEDDNVTYAEVISDKCFYHGYVKGHRSSYTAVSTCNGVAGYAQTDDEILFIEPSSGPQTDTGLQAHLVYTCEDRQPANETHQWAPKDYDDAQIDAHWRKKRAARRNPKYLEIFMAVAPSTVKVVGRNKVKNYVMTLLNIVSSVYQHSSLDVDIRIALVRLDFINERTAKRVTVKRNAYQTVRNFCEWAMYLHKPSDPQTHDIAVLLTREDLGPAGYAPITGMCNPIRSCAAIKDEGFTSAFIIAHEMAHVFGLFHDGHGNRCHGREYRTAIMATLVESKLNHYWWSICSQERMKAVVDYLYCLNDDPFQLEGLPDVAVPMGKSWSLNEQCILEFGSQFSLCRAETGTFYSDSCNMLWCGNYRNPHLCRTKRGPPLPGSPCGRDRQCRDGRCQYIGNQSPVHGQWGYWSQWTPCSSRCGIGLRYRSRKCDSPSPAYGGRDCKGGKDEMGTCVNKKCETYTDIRAGECQVWEEMNIRPGRHTWKPYPAKRREDRCKQTCISERTRDVVTIDIQTEDGTPCTYEDDDSICILGVCYNVGCDGVMNSTKKSDTCGVCGGDNSFCKTVTGEFLRKPDKKDEYEQVLFLPHGARNVEITKTEKSPHFLAIKDPERGSYYINGNGQPEKSKTVVADGALFNYARGQTYESLVSRGPLKRGLEIVLFPAGHLAPASISYSYTVNKDDHTLEKTKYKWKFSKWSECSVTCETGVQTIIHNCFDKYEDVQVNDEMCSFLDLPRQDQATCHRESCDLIRYIWAMFNNFTQCSETCGENGIQTQAYGCEKNYVDGATEYVEFSFCDKVPAPNETAPCNRIPCQSDFSYSWVLFDTYTECSDTCGEEGFQSLEYECERYYPNGTSEYVDEYLCEAPAPDEVIPCNRIPCIIDFSYKTMVFDTDCSETCGEGGFMFREYACEKHYTDNTMEYVDHSLCKDIPSSNDQVPCNRVPCMADFEYNWVVLDTFTDCTETCGDSGTQLQHYECEQHYSDGTNEYVQHHYCADVSAPNQRMPCNRIPCFTDITYDWMLLESFTECTKTCGDDGIKTQEYTCEKQFENGSTEIVEDYFCEELEPPEETVPCNIVPCEPEFRLYWGMLDIFTECSETCGDDGIETQNYRCEKHFISGTIEPVDDYYCEDSPEPEEVFPCNRFPCVSDFVYEWVLLETFSECSETCGEDGLQTQGYACDKIYLNGTAENVDDYFCDEIPSPKETVPCNRFPCVLEFRYYWGMLDTFTECSETCGEDGIKTQEYHCEKHYIDGTIENVEDHYCEDSPPFETMPCNRFPCVPDFVYGWVLLDTFTECSHTCGEDGLQTQEYACEKQYMNDTREKVQDDFCGESPAPEETVACNTFPCVLEYRYYWTMLETFTECSEICGDDGIQTQEYECEKHFIDGTIENVENYLCEESPVPTVTIPCNRFSCTSDFSYEWMALNTFTECSDTCGEDGTQMMIYGCEKYYSDDTIEDMDDVFCEDVPIPNETFPCNIFPCSSGFDHSWMMLETFSECSMTCGEDGTQTQKYSCSRRYSNDTTVNVEGGFCEDILKPNVTIPCNRFPCVLDFRYNWAMFDAFTDCSETCGDEGIQFQHYGCERTYPNDTTEYVDDYFCRKISPPDDPLSCNRVPCLLQWTAGDWSECSKTCGMGIQTREVFCGDPINWDENDVCVDDIPSPEKLCNRGPCMLEEPQSCKKDKYSFCKYASVKKCRVAGFRKMCCKSCFKGAAAYRRWKRLVRQKRRLRIKRRLKAKRRENRILKYD